MREDRTDWKTVATGFHRATRWLLAHQNRDGSWGSSTLEKVRWTSNIVMSLSVQIEPLPDSPLSNAIAFLKSDTVRRSEEWPLRIPALLAHYTDGEYEADVAALISVLPTLDLFFQTAILLNVPHAGLSGMRNDVASALLKRVRVDDEGLTTFSDKPNQNTLYALFVYKFCDDPEEMKRARSCLLATRRYGAQGDDSGDLTFSNSNGISGYVGLNLLQFYLESEAHEIEFEFFERLAKGFRLSERGNAEADVAGKEPFRSRSAIYTTSIYIRFISSLVEVFDDFGLVVNRRVLALESMGSHPAHARLIKANYVFIALMVGLFTVFLPPSGEMRSVVVGTIPGSILAVLTLIYTLILDRRRRP